MEPPARKVEKLSKLLFGAVGMAFGLDKLKNEGPPGADVVAAGKEVASDQRL